MKKKVLSTTLIFVVACTLLCACNTSKEKDAPTTDNNVSTKQENESESVKESQSDINDWTSYVISVDGVEFKLPCSYEKFADSVDEYIDSADFSEGAVLGSGEITTAAFKKDEYTTAYAISILNDSDTPANVLSTEDNKAFKNCKISGISQSETSISSSKTKVVFPGGLTAGMEITKEELISKFGEPDVIDDRSTEDINFVNYKWYETKEDVGLISGQHQFSIDVSDGVIYSISLTSESGSWFFLD